MPSAPKVGHRSAVVMHHIVVEQLRYRARVNTRR